MPGTGHTQRLTEGSESSWLSLLLLGWEGRPKVLPHKAGITQAACHQVTSAGLYTLRQGGQLASTASNTQVRMEHGVFLAWTPSAQLLLEGLRAHSFPERSQELNKATQGLENKGKGEVPDNPKMRSLPPSRPPFQLWQPGKLAVTSGGQVSGFRTFCCPRTPPPSHGAVKLSFHPDDDGKPEDPLVVL